MLKNNYHHGDLKNALIKAGLEILSEKGIEGLSLRTVAKKVGVSHAAPYNHFADKQALLAAMSTAGHEQLHHTLLTAFNEARQTSQNIIQSVARAYLTFACEDAGRFELMFSGALKNERDHPAFVEISQKNIALLEQIIIDCQNLGQMQTGDIRKNAIKLWSSVHGYSKLVIEKQLPEPYLQDLDIIDLLDFVIS